MNADEPLPRLIRPAGGFGTILIDPPWQYVMRSAKGEGKSPSTHYDCLSIEDIKALPVEAYAARDCALFCWAVWPMLPEALAAIAAWGFTYKTGAPWIKRTVNGKIQWGPGYVWRGCSEPLLVATRGAPSPAGGKSEQALIAVETRTTG